MGKRKVLSPCNLQSQRNAGVSGVQCTYTQLALVSGKSVSEIKGNSEENAFVLIFIGSISLPSWLLSFSCGLQGTSLYWCCPVWKISIFLAKVDDPFDDFV